MDLTIEPWVLVRDLDGRAREASLAETFERAHELTGVVGEIPTVSFAVFRLLLAVLYRSVGPHEDEEAWRELWERETLPVDAVHAYLDRHRSRFDLLHPETPFFQVADLRTAQNEVSGLERLIADVPNGAPYFTTRSGTGVSTIGFAEAARWLVHCQAYDPSGIKSGAVGDPRVKGGRGYPIGIAWTGNVGGLYLERGSLRDTLLLNLVPHAYLGLDPSQDLPAWERPAPTEKETVRTPDGPVDLFTWQSRRIRLFHDGERVIGVVIANGDPCAPQDRMRVEPMTAWRYSKAQQQKLGRKNAVYMPREHRPERAIWRGLEALLPHAVVDSGGDIAPSLPSKNLAWIARLTEEGALSPDLDVRTHAVGMTYGSMMSVITDVVDDAMSIKVALLATDHVELRTAAIDAAKQAEAGARALGQLAGNLTAAAGGDPSGVRDRASELAYAELDTPFRRWVAELGPGTDLPAAVRAWHAEARRIVGRLGYDLAERAGPAAWVGREVRGRRMNSAIADASFRRQLRAAFPFGYDDPDDIAREVSA